MVSVLNTRPQAQAAGLSALLRANGYEVIEQPLLGIEAAPHPDRARVQLATAAPDAAWIFVSGNAVDGARALLDQLPPKAVVIALGAATAQRVLTQFGRVAVTPAAGSDSAAILALPDLEPVRNVLILCAPGGRDQIASTLSARGKIVENVYTYQRRSADWRAASTAALRAAPNAILLATSLAALAALALVLDAQGLAALRHARLIVVSERIAVQAEQLGFSAITTARGATDAELLAAVLLTSTHE